MKNKISILILFLLCSTLNLNAQNDFNFTNNKKSTSLNFKFISNLIIIPVTVNNVELSFLLDTGSPKTLIFNLKDHEIFNKKGISKSYFKGISGTQTIEAFKIKDNQLKIKDLISNNHSIYLIENEEVNFFPKLGIPIHGIIGYDIFSKFRVDVNFKNKKLKISDNSLKLKAKHLKRTKLPLTIYDNKPHLMSVVKDNDDFNFVNLILDTGMSESIWLFTDNNVKVPTNNFDDFIARTITGNVYGKRAKMPELIIKNFNFKDVYVAYPDSVLTNSKKKKGYRRNGTLGSEILKRFHITFDYKNECIYLKKNSSYNRKFNYNISGLEFYYDGFTINKKTKNLVTRREESAKATYNVTTKVYYDVSNTIKILNVRKNSAAEEAGLKADDIILSINNKKIIDKKIDDLNMILHKKSNSSITLEIERNEEVLEFTFYNEDILN